MTKQSIPGKNREAILAGWKRIAEYLDVSTRTAQNWEKEQGLPIWRTPGEKGRVWADAREIDLWLSEARTTSGDKEESHSAQTRQRSAGEQEAREKPPEEKWRSKRLLLLLLILLIAVTLTSYTVYQYAGSSPQAFSIDHHELLVTDRTGDVIWKTAFNAPLDADWYAEKGSETTGWFGDLDEVEPIDMLFVYKPVAMRPRGGELLRIEGGRKVWAFRPGASLAPEGGKEDADYLPTSFLVKDVDRDLRPEVVVASRHVIRPVSTLAVLESDGSLKGEYSFPGPLEFVEILDLEGDGRQEVLIGGAHLERGKAAIVVLDAERLSAGGSPEGAPEEGAEKAMVFFERTRVNRILADFNMVRSISRERKGIRVHVLEETCSLLCEVIYLLSSDLEVEEIGLSESLKNLYEDLFRRKELGFPLRKAELEAMKKVEVLRFAPAFAVRR